jgi:translocation and assembly module TamB
MEFAMARNRDRLRATRNIEQADMDSDVDIETDTTLDRDDAARELDQLSRKRPARSMWPRFFMALFACVFLAVALTPTIVSQTSLGPKLIASGAKDRINGTVTVSAVRMGWFRAVSVDGLSVLDDEGQIVAEVESIRLSKGLFGLLTNMSNLGTITVEKPRLVLSVGSESSNIEELLMPLLRAKNPSVPATPGNPAQGGAAGAGITATVVVNKAEIELFEREYDKKWVVAPLDAKLEMSANPAEPLVAELAGRVEEAAFQANVALTMKPGGANASLPDVEATLEAERFPLAIAQTALERALGKSGIDGQFSGKMTLEMAQNAQVQRVEFKEVDARNVVFIATKYLGDDAISIERLTAGGQASLDQGIWDLKELRIDSDVAALRGEGRLRLADLGGKGKISDSDCDIAGRIDIARIAKMLPRTLHIREGIEFTSGEADWSLRTDNAQGDRTLVAKLTTRKLAALAEGRPIEWDQPITLDARVKQEGDSWRAEKLDIGSSFLKVTGNGAPHKGKLSLDGNLDQLVTEIEQIVDLGAIKMAGKFKGQVTWDIDDRQSIDVDSALVFTNVEVAAPGILPWQESELRIEAKAGGLRIDEAGIGLASGDVSVSSGEDRFTATLSEGVAKVSPETPLPVRFEMAGELATWIPRVQAFLPLKGFRIQGGIDLRGEALASASRVELEQAKLTASNLEVVGNGLSIREPQVLVDTSLVWDTPSGTLTTPSTRLQCSSVSVGAEQFSLQTKAGAIKVAGGVGLRANVNKVMNWLRDPKKPVTGRYMGDLVAQSQFNYAGGVTKATLTGTVENLAFQTPPASAAPVQGAPVKTVSRTPWTTVWKEPQVTFGGDASYDDTKDDLQLQKLDMRAGTTAVRATGAINQLLTQCMLDLQGDIEYDLADWNLKLKPYLGDMMVVEGRGKKSFEAAGPLFSAKSVGDSGNTNALLPLGLVAKAALGWDRADVASFPIGSGELAVTVKESIATVAPLELPVSDGLVRISPEIVLKGEEYFIAQDKIRLIDKVSITPEMCETWLKYVAPLAANATRAEGQFSLDLEGAAIPLYTPTLCDIRGEFTVHKVQIGPGELAQKLIAAAVQVKKIAEGNYTEALGSLMTTTPTTETSQAQWLTLPQQQIPVEVVEGRVRHENMRMQVKDITIRTSGSVGIADQSLEMVAEIPILDAWVKKESLAGLKGQTIKIPVRGTITKPQLDTRSLVQFQKQLATGAATAAVQGEVDKGIKKAQDAIGKKLGFPAAGSGTSTNPAAGVGQAVQEKAQQGVDMVEDSINKVEKKAQDAIQGGLNKLFGK